MSLDVRYHGNGRHGHSLYLTIGLCLRRKDAFPPPPLCCLGEGTILCQIPQIVTLDTDDIVEEQNHDLNGGFVRLITLIKA